MKHAALTHLIRFTVTGGYSGLFPVAPGTIGSLTTVVVIIILQSAFSLSTPALFALALISFAIGVPATEQALKLKLFPKKPEDPSEVVIDEVAGMFIAALGHQTTAPWLILSFFLFRAFDIFKPPPIAQLERLPGAWGIMADDVLAGLFACLSVWVIRYLLGTIS